MIDTSKLPFFMTAAALLIIIPGPSVFYIVTRSLDQGRLAGMVSMLGVSVGGLVHIAAAAFGLSALLASSATAFNMIKYLGAAYLIYLGIRRLLVPAEAAPAAGRARRKLSHMFYDGILVNLFNPKTALFFLAFLPQFVSPSLGPVSIQIMLLGGIFILIAIVGDGMYALLAGGLGARLQSNAGLTSAMRYFSGGVYIALGVATALSGPGRSK